MLVKSKKNIKSKVSRKKTIKRSKKSVGRKMRGGAANPVELSKKTLERVRKKVINNYSGIEGPGVRQLIQKSIAGAENRARVGKALRLKIARDAARAAKAAAQEKKNKPPSFFSFFKKKAEPPNKIRYA